MNLLKCKCSEKWHDVAPLVLRIAVGLVFAMHGYQKLSGGGFGGMLASLGVPAAGFFGALVTWVELLGGIALILGLLTHWSAKLLAIDMLVAFFLVHVSNGFWLSNGGYEFVIVLFAAAVSLLITGPGKWSLDEKWMK